MALAYICRIRTDLPDGLPQILDLQPNSSQYNIYQHPARGFYDSDFDGVQDTAATGQSGYMQQRVENDTLAALVANATVASYDGLSAYLIDNVIDAGGATITVGIANASAIAVLVDLDAGNAVDITNINAAIIAGGAGGGTTLTTGGSTGTVADVLAICAGAQYDLPSGSTVGALAAGAQLGSFYTGVYRTVYDTASLQVSRATGQLSVYANASFSYGGTAGAAVVVYDAAGAVLS